MTDAGDPPYPGPPPHAYLLGLLEHAAAVGLMRRWVYDAGEDGTARLLLCEHPPTITVGRQGSHGHLDLEQLEYRFRSWPLSWVNRAAGCWLHLPGQLAIYPVVPLRPLGLSVAGYLARLRNGLAAALRELELNPAIPDGGNELWVGGRPVASVGIAVRDWVAYHGAILNVDPPLECFKAVRTGKGHPPMTSLQRACRRPVRPALVRELVIRHLAAGLGLGHPLLFTEHPNLTRKVVRHALAPAR